MNGIMKDYLRDLEHLSQVREELTKARDRPNSAVNTSLEPFDDDIVGLYAAVAYAYLAGVTLVFAPKVR